MAVILIVMMMAGRSRNEETRTQGWAGRSFLGRFIFGTLVESGKAEESKLKRFMKSEWFWIVYLLLTAFLAGLLAVYVVCYSTFIIPLVMFIIPYWLKEKRIRRLLLNGVIVFILAALFAGAILTALYSAYSPSSELSGESGTVSLSHGIVEPFDYGGNPGTVYRFTVVYKNTVIVGSSDVGVVLEIWEYTETTSRKYDMVGNTAGNVTAGWVFTLNMTVPEGMWWHAFNETTKGSSVTTAFAFGPRNAPWTRFFSTFVPYYLLSLVLPVSLYYIIVGMYWWMEKAKMMRPPPAKRPIEKQRAAEFDCTNCGADVPADASRCPRCGAVFEDEEEPEKEKKGDEERDLATKKKASIIEKKEK